MSTNSSSRQALASSSATNGGSPLQTMTATLEAMKITEAHDEGHGSSEGPGHQRISLDNVCSDCEPKQFHPGTR